MHTTKAIYSCLIFLLLMAHAIAAVPASLQNKVIGVRLDDLASVAPTAVSGLPEIIKMIKKNPGSFFTQGEVEVVHDVFFRKMPEDNAGQVDLAVTAFVKYKKDIFTFEKLQISYSVSGSELSQIYVFTEAVYPLSEMIFQAKVGLIDRKLILIDEIKEIKIIFPLGVGSFDQAVMNEDQISLLTPRLRNGFIDRRAVISKREKPRYYQKKPFIRVLKGPDIIRDITSIGFHIEINKSFIRGFDSHGCIRLREMDLMAFHDLIIFGGQQQLPLTIQYRLEDLGDSPIGKIDSTFKTVLNMGTAENPFFITDRDNLIQLVYREGQVPTANLHDDIRDNYYDFLNYDTVSQTREQDLRRKNECDAKVMNGTIKSDPKSYQKCMDEGKRKDTLRDRIYRKYMGIDTISSFPGSDDFF